MSVSESVSERVSGTFYLEGYFITSVGSGIEDELFQYEDK
jgi:hypothetical protein